MPVPVTVAPLHLPVSVICTVVDWPGRNCTAPFLGASVISIGGAGSERHAREYFLKNVKGLGLKEASHYLRNVGHGKTLAILDRHILKNLVKCGAIEHVPASLTEKRYFEIEREMENFCKKTGIPLAHLDLLFWAEETGEIFK